MALRSYGSREYVGIVFNEGWWIKEICVAGRQFSFNEGGASQCEESEKHLQ